MKYEKEFLSDKHNLDKQNQFKKSQKGNTPQIIH